VKGTEKMNIEHRTSNIECWMGKKETNIQFRRNAARLFGTNHNDC